MVVSPTLLFQCIWLKYIDIFSFWPAFKEFGGGKLSQFMRWVNLEPVIQSEVREKKNLYYCIYMESRKLVMMNIFAGQE